MNLTQHKKLSLPAMRSMWRAAVLALALIGSHTAVAQAQNAAQVGLVDGEKLDSGYKQFKTAVEDINKRKEEVEAQMNARIFVASTDTARFDALIVKKTRTPAEEAELQKLVKSGGDRRTEYNGLMGKATKSADEQTRFKTLEDEVRKNAPSFQTLATRIEDEMTKTQIDVGEDYSNRILKAIEQVAAERKLVLVVGKQAIQALAYSAPFADITDDVFEALEPSLNEENGIMNTLRMKHFLSVPAIAILMLCATPSAVKSQTLAVGVFDEDSLGQRYTKYKQAIDTLYQRTGDIDAQLDAREYLVEAEAKRFDELSLKEGRTEAENTELLNIVKAGSARRAEFVGLLGKAKRDAAEETRLKQLQTEQSRNRPGVVKIQDELFNQVKRNQQAIDKEYTERANEVVKQVAADKKLNLVWRKRAVLWNAPSIDITDEVLTRLNKS